MSHRINSNVLDAWCERWLKARPVLTLFEAGYLSAVVGVELPDGRQIVVKIRPPSGRLAACTEVQRQLWQAGFPCPQPLVAPAAFGELIASAEAYLSGGEQLAIEVDSPRLFAEGLANLIALSPAVDSVGS